MGDLFDGGLFAEGVDDGSVRWPRLWFVEGVGEGGFGERCFAAAGGADDCADFPGFIESWYLCGEVVLKALVEWDVQHSCDLQGAESGLDWGVELEGDGGHGVISDLGFEALSA